MAALTSQRCFLRKSVVGLVIGQCCRCRGFALQQLRHTRNCQLPVRGSMTERHSTAEKVEKHHRSGDNFHQHVGHSDGPQLLSIAKPCHTHSVPTRLATSCLRCGDGSVPANPSSFLNSITKRHGQCLSSPTRPSTQLGIVGFSFPRKNNCFLNRFCFCCFERGRVMQHGLKNWHGDLPLFACQVAFLGLVSWPESTSIGDRWPRHTASRVDRHSKVAKCK